MNNHQGVLWITGLSASGKTTLTEMIQELLLLRGITPILLDGDLIRTAIADPYWLYDEQSRLNGSYRYSRLAKLFSEQGHLVLVPTISMFHEVRAWNRNNISNYFEIYISLPERLRVERDYKGIYKKDNLSHVVGQNDNVQLPVNSDLNIENSGSYEELKGYAESVVERFLSKRGDEVKYV